MYQFMISLDAKIKGEGVLMTHSGLSFETGRANAWFNNSFNNLEDLRISSFLRILAVANERHKANTGVEIDGEFLINIFNSKILETANGINILSLENETPLLVFIQSEERLFQDLIGYWGILSSKGKLTDSEESVLKEIRRILNS